MLRIIHYQVQHAPVARGRAFVLGVTVAANLIIVLREFNSFRAALTILMAAAGLVPDLRPADVAPVDTGDRSSFYKTISGKGQGSGVRGQANCC